MNEETNPLFPIFVKLNEKRILIIGGGTVALEKLTTVLRNSPKASVRVISKDFCEDLINLANSYKNVFLFRKAYDKNDLLHCEIAISAIGSEKDSAIIQRDCKERGILLNCADKPEYCDYYLGGVVSKGPLKIAISTNGKSPLMARRMREFMEDVIPDDIAESIENLSEIRKRIRGNLQEKVRILNQITESFLKNY